MAKELFCHPSHMMMVTGIAVNTEGAALERESENEHEKSWS